MNDLYSTVINALVEELDALHDDDNWIARRLDDAEMDNSIANTNEVKRMISKLVDEISEYSV